MKTFRKQFNQCIENGTCEQMNLRNKETVDFRTNTKGIDSMEIDKTYFCNKYLKRCSSKVCLNERMRNE